jgi:hypothetical protein
MPIDGKTGFSSRRNELPVVILADKCNIPFVYNQFQLIYGRT